MHDDQITAEKIDAQARVTPLPLRDDTMLGVCTGFGEEFGFNPNYLRVAIGTLVLFDIMLAVGVYLGLGIALAAGRLLFPPSRRAPADQVAEQPMVEANDAQATVDSLAA